MDKSQKALLTERNIEQLRRKNEEGLRWAKRLIVSIYIQLLASRLKLAAELNKEWEVILKEHGIRLVHILDSWKIIPSALVCPRYPGGRINYGEFIEILAKGVINANSCGEALKYGIVLVNCIPTKDLGSTLILVDPETTEREKELSLTTLSHALSSRLQNPYAREAFLVIDPPTRGTIRAESIWEAISTCDQLVTDRVGRKWVTGEDGKKLPIKPIEYYSLSDFYKWTIRKARSIFEHNLIEERHHGISMSDLEREPSKDACLDLSSLVDPNVRTPEEITIFSQESIQQSTEILKIFSGRKKQVLTEMLSFLTENPDSDEKEALKHSASKLGISPSYKDKLLHEIRSIGKKISRRQ